VSPLARILGARGSVWLLAGVAAALALLPIEGWWGAALRACALLGALGLAAAALRPPRALDPDLRLAARHPLGREAGVALLEAGGRRLLVGYAPAGVCLLADLSAEARP
jgi:hypothetical protein